MVLEYLDKHGYPFKPTQKPVFLRDEGKAASMARVARYITCPLTKGLKWIGHCEACKEFKGHVKYTGVECAAKI